MTRDAKKKQLNYKIKKTATKQQLYRAATECKETGLTYAQCDIGSGG